MAQLTIHAKNMEISQPLRDYIQKKLGRLDRHLPSISTVEVQVSRESTKSQESRYVVQATLNVNGKLLRGQEHATTVLTAVDSVVGAIERQIERFKGKRYRSFQRPAAEAAEGPEETAADEEAPPEGSTPAPLVARVKRFPMKPMPVEEAIDQMELLGHDFFLFLNDQSNQFNVVYRRRDGAYGLIEPAVG